MMLFSKPGEPEQRDQDQCSPSVLAQVLPLGRIKLLHSPDLYYNTYNTFPETCA